MTGFIRGLFNRGGGSKQAEIYLDSDSAKTYGDTNYMRRATEVKKTFPKPKEKQAEEYFKSAPVSSVKKAKSFDSPMTQSAMNPADSSVPSPSGFAQASSFAEANFQPQMTGNRFGSKSFSSGSPYSLETERRRPDSKMNEFRKMAKDMKKR
ncbi:MAG: hypothetical protein ACFBSC_16195 [Microcoleaceae cyanobacterium]